MARRIILQSFLMGLLMILSVQVVAQIPGEGWGRIGVNFSGDITALAISPNYNEDKTLFVATAEGELCISNDRGENWRICQGFPGDEVATSIALPKKENLKNAVILFQFYEV